MTDIRRTLLWVVFSMSLLLLWDAWNKHNGSPSLFNFGAHPTAAAPAPAGTAGATASALPAPIQGQVPVAAAAAVGGASLAAPAVPAAPSEKLVITTDVLRVTLDSQGGGVDRAELLKYRDQADPNRHVVLLDSSAQRTYQAETGYLSPTPGVTLPTHFTPMTAVPGDRTLKEGAGEISVRFESADVGGAKWVKTYTFHRGEYTIGVKDELTNESTAPIQAQLYLQLVRDGNAPPGESSFYHTFTGPALFTDAKKFQKVEFKDIEKRKPDENPSHATSVDDGWVAMVQHYFASAWLVPDGSPREFRTAKISNNLYAVAMVLPLGSIAPGATRSQNATLFVGPQEEKKLAALAPGLELMKDYGYFKILAEPLFWLLDELNKILGNWGWAIVALVFLLKAAFYYLNASAYKSMAKMKAVNPKVMEMRERYKDKPQQMQQEMMRIYREEKVNPIGSCLPIFLQMPFFIALYWVLLSSVEMRGAPWIGWIGDLSARDPFFILPVLMTASSLLQVWLNPTPPDPMQAKLMWIMPLAFSVMFFFFPAGLVLYWLTNNLLSIAQQWFINKRLGLN